MIDYFLRYHNRLLLALLQHLIILGLTMGISVILASAITLSVSLRKRVAALVLRVFGAVYAIPSLALFAIFIPVLGIGLKTAVFVLVLYNQFLLIRNFLSGLDATDAALIEAGVGMGMTPFQVLLTIKVPLAFPSIMAGLRLAVISTIGIGTIAAVINAGGIGSILFDGLRTMNPVKIVWGSLLSALLAVGANALLGIPERSVRRKLYGAEDGVRGTRENRGQKPFSPSAPSSTNE